MLSTYTVETRGLRAAATIECPPDYDNSEVLVLAPGLASAELTKLRGELASLGHAAISFEQPRAGYVRWFGDVGELRARMLEELAEGARAQYGIARCALIGHSLGGVDALKVAGMTDDADSLSSMELMACAGLTGENLLLLTRRLSREGLGELKMRNHSLVRSNILSGLRNPMQLVSEGRYARRDIIDELGSCAKEVDAGLLQFKDDGVFPEELLDQRVRGFIASDHIRSALATSAVHACHSAPYCDPVDTAQAIGELLGRRKNAA